MACPNESVVLELLGGRLQAGEAAAIELHLDSCPDCRRLVAELARGEPRQTPASSQADLGIGSGESRAQGSPHGREGAGAEATLAFAEGAVVAGRYRIVQFLARGGMGEVYEAEDLEIHERVALKTLRRHFADEPRMIERFKREIQLARRVTHRNICRLFEFGVHRPESEGPVAFLTMELLPGETLARRLRRAGPLRPTEALPLARQMAAALDAAHAAGVVHCDFKSENVFLVPAGESEVPRVVVTDFGLARPAALPLAGRDPGSPSTLASSIGGTPAYMAPEQVEGHAGTAATDVYALGVVLYELVTGVLPFEGGGPSTLAERRLHEAPTPPRERVKGLDPVWDAAILRCLARRPADRFPSAGTAISALESGRPGGRPRRKGVLTVLAISAAVAGTLAIGVRTRRAHHAKAVPSPAVSTPAAAAAPFAIPPQVRPRVAVAVLGLHESGAPNAAWLSPALSKLLSASLSAGQALRAVSTDAVSRALSDLSSPDPSAIDAAGLARLRALLDADFFVTGTYEDQGGKVRLALRLLDAASGRPLAVEEDTAAESDLVALAARAGAKLRFRLGVPDLTSPQIAEVRSSMPTNATAARLYAEGLAHAAVYDLARARDLFRRVIATEPEFPLSHLELSDIAAILSDDALAVQEAEAAYRHAEKLPRPEQLSIEASWQARRGDFAKAAEIEKALWLVYPDDLDFGLSLVYYEDEAGQAKDALATLAALRRLPAPYRDDPMIDMREAYAEQSLSHFEQARVAYARAKKKAQAEGARTLLAEAEFREATNSFQLQQYGPALTDLRDAERIFAEIGDRGSYAQALTQAAAILDLQGDRTAASAAYRAAITALRAIGSVGSLAFALSYYGNLLGEIGDFTGCRRAYAESRELDRRAGNLRTEAADDANLAGLLDRQGDHAGAIALLQEAQAIDHRIGNATLEAGVLEQLGEVKLGVGDLAGARMAADDALRFFRAHPDREDEVMTLILRGNVLYDQGDLDAAREDLDRARSMLDEVPHGTMSADARLALAEVALAKAKPSVAGTLAQDALQIYQAASFPDGQAQASTFVAFARLADGHLSEAQQAQAQAEALGHGSQDSITRTWVALGRARCETASGRFADARRSANEALTEARKSGALDLEFTARLVLAHAQMKGDAAAGRETLESVTRDAKAKGFGSFVTQTWASLR